MRGIVLWRWIFGLALVPAALLARFGGGAAEGAGLVSLTLYLYPLCVLAAVALLFVAGWAWLLALDAWDFTLCLAGLRDAGPSAEEP